ncbi:Hybrid signal transduction histidine kinase J [Lachnellula suecica]|uniref:Hybrid signal transduction histidine kinase J n=1 Tax=Lachnellula suecica TaxID=602035 RepID=A0A8T9C2I3_9HELO|nr:Hybrid signal transduction histidine kinase J [Lachnellula suecica]
MQSHERSKSELNPTIDLQLAVLRHLPTPIIVLSPTHEVAFANRAVERLLAHATASRNFGCDILGRAPDQIGLALLCDRSWDTVLRDSLEVKNQGGQDGDPVNEVSVAVLGSKVNTQEDFRILISTTTLDNGINYVLSFEKLRLFEKPPSPEYEKWVSLENVAGSGANGAKPITADTESAIPQLKRAIFDSSTLCAYMITADASLYVPNKKVTDLLGASTETCDGQAYRNQMPLWDETFSRKIDTEEYPLLNLVKSQKPFRNLKYGAMNRFTGERVLVTMHGECLYDDTGVLIGGICWWLHIEDYSNFLVEQKQRFLESHETICNMLPQMIWSSNTEGRANYFSQRWYEFTGLTREESLGIGYHSAIHPNDVEGLCAKWKEWAHGEKGDFSKEVRYRQHDGVYRWMLVLCCTLNDEDGKPINWYGSTTDIHDIVMARIAAATQKQEMLKVLAHGDVNVYSIDDKKMVEWAEGGMPCMTSFDTISEDDHDHEPSLLGCDAIEAAQARQPGGVPGYENNILDILAGKIDTGLSIDPIGGKLYKTRLVAKHEHNPLDGAQKPLIKGILGLSIDVTDMKLRADLEIDNTRLALEEQAAKESNKMSHEMRTPTAGVIGMVDLLSEDPTLTSEQREYVSCIQLSARALLTIVNDILDFSKIESGRLEIEEVPFQLSGNVSGLVKLLGMFAEQKGIELAYVSHIDPKLVVLGDPGRTRQVLSNLLTTALKFTKEGKVTLTVTSTAIPSDSGERIEVKFSVEDTGIGIEKHVLHKIFQPFSQGDASTARLFGGTGLGLTISQNARDQTLSDTWLTPPACLSDERSITLTSVPNKGSTATFTLRYKVSPHEIPARSANENTRAPPFSSLNSGVSSTSRFWSPPLAHRSFTSPNDEITKQEAVNTVTNYPQQPLEHAPRQGSSDSTTELSSEDRKNIHILVVEDNPINQKMALTNIRKLHFSVAAVWNGREALSYVLSPSAERPRPDMILMDIQMPQMDGYEATRLLRRIGRPSTTDSSGKRPVSPPEIASLFLQRKNGKNGNPSEEFIQNIRVSIGQVGEAEREKLGNVPVIAMTASAIQASVREVFDFPSRLFPKK